MKVGVFYQPDNPEHCKTLSSFSIGVEAFGDFVDFRRLNTYEGPKEFDVCVVFGVYKKAVPISKLRGKVIEEERSADKDIIILEKGYIRRDKYYSAGLNNFNGRAVFNNTFCPSDRFEALDIKIKPWKMKREDYILIMGQVPWDASVQHMDHVLWVHDTVRLISELTDRPIIFRPHPLAPYAIKKPEKCDLSNQSLEKDLDIAHAVVTFNSNTGVDAVLSGIPTFCSDPGSMIYPMAAEDLSHIEHPPLWIREDWAYNLAYTQWTCDEMKKGLPWQNLRELIVTRKEDQVA